MHDARINGHASLRQRTEAWRRRSAQLPLSLRSPCHFNRPAFAYQSRPSQHEPSQELERRRSDGN